MPPFDPRKRYATRLPLTWGGRDYVPGEPIPVPEDPVSLRRFRAMYRRRMIHASDHTSPLVTENSPKAGSLSAPPEGEPVSGNQAVHRGRGRWAVVDADGIDLYPGELFSREDAEDLAAGRDRAAVAA